MLSEQLLRKDSTSAVTADNKSATDAVALWIRDEVPFGRWIAVPGVRFESISAAFEDRPAEVSQVNECTEAPAGIGTSYAWGEDFTLMGGVHSGLSPATSRRGAALESQASLRSKARSVARRATGCDVPLLRKLPGSGK